MTAPIRARGFSRVMVTGANGFLGRFLCAMLSQEGWRVEAVVRRPSGAGVLPSQVAERVLAPFETVLDWDSILESVDVVVHLAARVHRLVDSAADPSGAYRAVNVDGTLRLAEAAARCGVKRFIFMSTVKVCGESRERPYRDSDPADPQDPYSLSKWEAEQGPCRAFPRQWFAGGDS